jgi:hypothetical protein
MSDYRVQCGKIKKGGTQGGAKGFVSYLLRDFPADASKYLGYIDRSTNTLKQDFVTGGAANLPAWATNAHHFFTMADRYERQNAVVARVITVSLPRELSQEGRLALSDDIRAAFFTRHPHVWAMHNPQASDGGEHPHVHYMLSERQNDAYPRNPKLFFSRTATQEQDPATHGARKDPRWQRNDAFIEARYAIATLTNAALEREGHAIAVSHQSLRIQGQERAASHISGKLFDPALVHEDRQALRAAYYPLENEIRRAHWAQEKTQYSLDPHDRQGMIDHVRERFWAHDHSPYREHEREQAFERSIERALWTHERAPQSARPRTHEPHIHDLDESQAGLRFKRRSAERANI